MVVHICNPSTWETEAEGSQDWDSISERKTIHYVFHHSNSPSSKSRYSVSKNKAHNVHEHI